ncbi:MAG TPA: imidazole glycerol phosphate synthase subunit HisH [Chitinophagaceae bacterium]|nr:imidazole glycerol phosphate synthase subunit HisH [Chitinophagaceae bacterium]
MRVVIIKYNAGNIQSVLYALARVGLDAIVSDDPDTINTADKVIFPGVGEASSAMQYLQARKLDSLIKELKQPVLGICLGMQLLCRHSEENNTKCLNIFTDTDVKRFSATDCTLKVPHIGWNNINKLSSEIFYAVAENSYCYYVHSYFAEISPYTIASTNYGIEYSAAMQKDNFYGVQFHPEKSGKAGEQVLKNFLTL